MASIARKNLFEDIPRFLVAQAGIMFAVSLITIQTGILNGFTRSTGVLIDQSSADLWVASEKTPFLDASIPLPIERLVEARKVAGVQQAEGLLIRSTLWQSPTGQLTPLRIYGFDPQGHLFADWQMLEGSLDALKSPYTIVIDKANRGSLDIKQLGDAGTIGSLPAKLVGLTAGTQSITSGATAYTSLETATAYINTGFGSAVNCTFVNGDIKCLSSYESQSTPTGQPPAPKKLSLSDTINFILIQAKPGQDLSALQRQLQTTLPGTHAFTKAEIADMTRSYWLKKTGVGFILGLGAAVGFVVGLVVVSQILYSSVSDHLKEYGTLKAMGASDLIIYRVITEQALWMAVLGYLPSMLLCLGLGSWTMTAKGIMILITPVTAIGVLGITVVMCVGSALFAIQKVTHVDPAIVFKA